MREVLDELLARWEAGQTIGMGTVVATLSALTQPRRVWRRGGVRADGPLVVGWQLAPWTTARGQAVAIDLGLRQGASRVVSLRFSLERDTRTDPVLPRDGSRLQVAAELGATLLGGSYDFTSLLARYERWWPMRHGALAVGIRLGGAASFGDAPRFDRLHLGDLNRLVTPRALGLMLSAEPAPDLLGGRAEDEAYGDVGGSASVEVASRLFRGGDHLYGGDLFIAVGGWALASRGSPAALGGGVLADLFIDAGLRLDTELGTFELTFANAFGRVAL